MHQRDFELIHHDLDRLLSPKKKQKLDKLLSEDPEARNLHEELSRLSEVLQAAEDHEPPEHLSRQIMNSLPVGLYRQAGTISPFVTLASFVKRLNAQMLYGFSTGLVTALVVFAIYLGLSRQGASGDYSELSGTLLLENAGHSNATVEAFPIQLPGVAGSVRCSVQQDFFLVDIVLTSAISFELNLAFAQSDLAVHSVRNPIGDLGLVSIDTEGLTVTGKGDYSWEILLHPQHRSPAPLMLSLIAGKQDFQKALTLDLDNTSD